MIDRYTLPEMGMIWELQNRFEKMLDVEIAVAQTQAMLGIIPKKAALDIKKNAKFSVKRVLEIEQVTKHDLMAFVKNLAENVGVNGKYVHYGLTSSDVVDTSFSLQVRDAAEVLQKKIRIYENTVKTLVKKYDKTLCSGRTHGMWAEPVTFGLKLASHLVEIKRNNRRFKVALKQFCVAKLSGAVGTYSSLGPIVESKVAKKLNLRVEDVATQVVPRDRHAEMLFSLCMIAAQIERLAVELRHLQRSEVGEVYEGFSSGQTGSSAMPHKKNPISSENLTGLSRLMRSYLSASLENTALWHERDISHSSVERVVFPDAFIVCDYMINRMTGILNGLYVNKDKMIDNIASSQGVLFTSHVLLALVKEGMTRDEAYGHLQRLSHNLKPSEHLHSKILKDPILGKKIKTKDLKKIFSGEVHLNNILPIIKKALKTPQELL